MSAFTRREMQMFLDLGGGERIRRALMDLVFAARRAERVLEGSMAAEAIAASDELEAALRPFEQVKEPGE